MRSRGISLVEILVVMSLIAVLAGFLFPVIVSAKRGGQIVKTQSNLHQQWMAVKLYQENWGGEESWGSAAEMHLPDPLTLVWWNPDLGLGHGVWTSPCGHHPMAKSGGQIDYEYRILRDERGYHDFRDRAILYQDNLLVSMDLNCNDAKTNIQSQYESKFAAGVLLSGQLVRRRDYGNVEDNSWWAPPVF